jgi:hypothetical protein
MVATLFSTPFHAYREDIKQRIGEAVEQASESEITNADDSYLNTLLSEYQLQPLAVNWRERKETVRDFAWGEQEVIRQVYTFEVKYSGSRDLLHVQPSTSRLWRFETEVVPDAIRFEIADKGNEQANKLALQSIKENLEFDISHLNNELGIYHSEIAAYAENILRQRKECIESAVQSMGGFGVPVRGLNLEPEE